MSHHKKPAGIRALLFTMVFSLAAGWLSQTSILRAEDTSNTGWLDAELNYQVEEIITGAEAQKAVLSAIDGGHCWENMFNQKFTKNGQTSYPKNKVGCAVDTGYGVAAGSNFHEYGEAYAGKFHPTNSFSYHPIPNSSTLIALSGSNDRNIMRFYHSFASQAEIANVNGLEMTYILKNHNEVTDNAGNLLYLDDSPPRSSKNGRWVVTYSPNRSSIRVDLSAQHGNLLPFGTGKGPLRQGISNDGRYVVVFYLKSKMTHLYDLSTCPLAPDIYIGTLDCEYRDISAFLNQQLGSVKDIERIEFLDENHVLLFVKHADSNGEYTMSKIQLAPSDQPFLNLDGGYIAMGDSFASGEGDMDSSFYEVGTDEPENKCHLSRRSYPYLINQLLGFDDFHSVACSGATKEHLTSLTQSDEPTTSYPLGDWLPGTQAQFSFNIQGPSVITLSIGGNDVGFGSKLTECVLWGGTCKYAEPGEHRARVAKEIAQMGRTLKGTYEQIISKTGSKTKLYVVGYPQIIKPEDGSCGLNVKLNKDERRFIFEATKYMNQVVEAATNSAGAYYLDIENALEDKNLCSLVTDSGIAVNGLTFGDDKEIPWWIGLGVGGVPGLIAVQNLGIANESYHPNQNGHSLMYDSVMNDTSGNPLTYPVCSTDISQAICPNGDGKVPLPDVTYWGSEAFSFVSGLHLADTLGVNSVPTYKPMIIVDDNDGSKAKIMVDHLKPGSKVNVEIHSDPILVGNFDVDLTGRLEEPIDIPSGITAGFHTLRLTGLNTANDEIEYYEPVFIPGPEGDLDANGLPDKGQACGFVEDSGVDNDQDGIDDSCDSYIAAVTTEVNPNTTDIQETLTKEASDDAQTTTQIINRALSTDASQLTRAAQLAVITTNSSNPPEVKAAGDFDGKQESEIDTSAVDSKEDTYILPMLGLMSVILVTSLVYLARRYSIN